MKTIVQAELSRSRQGPIPPELEHKLLKRVGTWIAAVSGTAVTAILIFWFVFNDFVVDEATVRATLRATEIAQERSNAVLDSAQERVADTIEEIATLKGRTDAALTSVEDRLLALDNRIQQLDSLETSTRGRLSALEDLTLGFEETQAVAQSLQLEISGVVDDPEFQALVARSLEDRLFNNAVVAFSVPTCPPGWTPFDRAEGRFVLGAGQGPLREAVIVGQTGGAEEVTLTVAQMPAHDHTGDWRYSDSFGFARFALGNQGARLASTGDPQSGWGFEFDPLEEQGSGQPHLNMPPYITLYWCSRTSE